MRRHAGRSASPLGVLLVVAPFAAACGDDSLVPPPGPNLAIGTWGGDDAGVVVTESAAHVHIGCTFGDIEGSIPLDAGGRFTVEGSYVPRAYPVQVGPSVPAEFSGRVVGGTLTLSVSVNDTVEGRVIELGPVTLEYAREPDMRMCPICRVPPSVRRVDGSRQPLSTSTSSTLVPPGSSSSAGPIPEQ
ncbi:MAG: hypothetical protein R3195_08005 [Gemmatimonadota bacterium]|nr:hypothetical protein [Gemmatimonadota bacterium]